MSGLTITIQAPELAQAINRLATALENRNSTENTTAVHTAVRPQKEPATQTTVTDEQTVEEDNTEALYRIEDVRAAFADYAKLRGKDKAKEILSKFGATKVTALKESDYNAVMEMLKG